MSLSPAELLWLAAGAVTVSWAAGAFVRAHAARLRLIDVPNARSSHAIPTPRGGGVGIVAGSLGGTLLLRPLGIDVPFADLLALAAGGAFVAAISFIDDLWSLPPAVRLGIHIACAAFALRLVGGFLELGFTPHSTMHLGWTGALLTVLWITGLTNAYNFMDGTDGLAGVQGVIAAAGWVAVGWWIRRPDVAMIAAFIALACAGFLVHNWAPARLFMGDVGSAFLGYSLAVITVIAARQHPVTGIAGVLVLWPFIFDPVFTFLRRAWRREDLLSAHRSHLYQRLVATGWTHQAVCGLYALLALAGAAAGFALVTGAWWAPAVTMLYAAGSVVLVGALVRRRECQGAA